MSLPYNLQKLPPEALTILRFLGQTRSADADEMHDGTDLPPRTVGKAIRRLVTLDYISVNFSGGYELTTDGTRAVQQLAEYDGTARPAASAATAITVSRRLAIVVPRQLMAGIPAELFIGVNAPTGSARLSGEANIEIKLRAVGGMLSTQYVALSIPADKASQPERVRLTPTQAERPVRVRVDAFQSNDFDAAEPLGWTYFDVPVAVEMSDRDASQRAFGMDLTLKPPR